MMLTRSRLVVSLIVTGAILAFLFAAPRQPAKSSSEKKSSPAINVSQTDSDPALLKAINERLEQSDSNQARWGVFVMSLSDGRVLYSRDGQRLFTPASNMKIFTTAVALALLGEGYRWRT